MPRAKDDATTNTTRLKASSAQPPVRAAARRNSRAKNRVVRVPDELPNERADDDLEMLRARFLDVR